MSADYTNEERDADVVDRLKAGAALKLFVFALQLVSQSLFDSVKKRFIVGKQPLHHWSTGLVQSENWDSLSERRG